MSYIELHCHSCFSFREGASTPVELVLRAAQLGYKALALTDHDNLAGAMEFANAAKSWGIRPIFGAEITLSGDTSAEYRAQSAENTYHLTLLVETPRGYANLSRLLSRANLASPRGEPRVRSEWLPEHAEGLIALSGCRKGEIASLIERNQDRAAREAAERYRAVFGRESFFIELQENLVYEDQSRNEGLVAVARDLGLNVVATNNVHYHQRERHRLHDVLVAVRHRTNLEEARPLLRPNSEFYLKHPAEVQRLFDGLSEAIDNTLRIAERCTGVQAYEHMDIRAEAYPRQPRPKAVASDTPDSVPSPGQPGVFGSAQARDSDLHGNHGRGEAHALSPIRASYNPGWLPLREPAAVYEAINPGLKSGAFTAPNSNPEASSPGFQPGGSPTGVSSPGLQSGASDAGFDITRDLSYVFPDYVSADGRSADEFLRDLCYQKAREHYGRPLPEQVEIRLLQELELVRQGKRAGFFLRLWELLEFAHKNELPARGRGSSVGSMVCFLLGLSGIDPMKYHLVVERFLNEERLEEDVPDIDLDFGRDARDRMFRHIFETYGTAHAAQVAALIEYRYASAIRDVGKALGLPQGEIDKIAKRMRSRFAGSLEDELAAMPDFAPRLRFPIWRDFVELVNELRGLPRHLSQHSGGVIISTTRIDEQVPVEAAAMDGRFICQWDKDSVADAGFVKLDLLGYPSLDQLERGLRYVRERHGRVIRPQQIDLSDPEVYSMIQQGDVLGIVQIQSRAQIQVLLRIKVRRIEDLIIQVALIRPGPIQGGAVHPYIARCLGQEPVIYDHPSLEPALAETKGVFVFQEQVIQAAMAIAGFSSGQAEVLRRAMSRKRSREAMEALRNEFLAGAAVSGISHETAVTVYNKILAFAEFGFPKSHAAAMAETAFRVAWLKRYYPAEFYCALLNEQPMGFYSPEVIVNDARRHGIEVRGVNVNHSDVKCTIEPDPGSDHDALRIGYRYLKGLGDAAYERLHAERINGAYRSLWDFWRRTRLNREPIENLIRAGAFAWTGLHERELLWQLGTFYQPLGAQMPLPLAYGHTGNRAIGQLGQADAEQECRGRSTSAGQAGGCPASTPFLSGAGAEQCDSNAQQTRQSPDNLPPKAEHESPSTEAGEFIPQSRGSGGAAHARKALEVSPQLPSSSEAGVAGAQPMRGGFGGCPPTSPNSEAEQRDSDAQLPPLREPTHKERIIADLLLTGIAVRGRSMDLIADQMHEGITPSHLVNEMQPGQKVTVAGLVAVRQSPETAKGFVFHTLEDYYGLMNVITAPRLIPRYRRLIESAPAVIVHGHIERQERSVNVIAERFEALSIVSDAGRRVHSFG